MVYHVLTTLSWNQQEEQNHINHKSLETEGFIHCCMEDQLVHVLSNYFYTGEELILLKLDQDKLAGVLKMELSSNSEYFPHIYGTIQKEWILEKQELGNPF